MAEDNKPKRRLKTGGESVRQRTRKLEDQKQTVKDSKQTDTVFTAFWRGFTLPVRTIGKAIARLGRFKAVRFIGRILFPRYIRNSWRELRMVTWPDRRTSWKLTYAVIIFSVLFGAVVAVLDFGLDKLFKEIILK